MLILHTELCIKSTIRCIASPWPYFGLCMTFPLLWFRIRLFLGSRCWYRLFKPLVHQIDFPYLFLKYVYKQLENLAHAGFLVCTEIPRQLDRIPSTRIPSFNLQGGNSDSIRHQRTILLAKLGQLLIIFINYVLQTAQPVCTQKISNQYMTILKMVLSRPTITAMAA